MSMKKVGLFALSCLLLAGCAVKNKDAMLDAQVANEAVDESKALILFLVDSSESMLKNDLDANITRMDAAQKNLKDIVQILDLSKANLGLINFGGKCEVTNSIKATGNTNYFTAKVDNIKADGYTPLADSIKAANSIIKERNGKNVHIVLLSDGLETCGGDPKAQMSQLINDNPDAKISAFVLGYDVDDFAKNQLKDLLRGEGRYFDIADTREMSNALNAIVTQTELNSDGWEDGVYNFGINFDLNSDVIKPEFFENVKKLADYMLKTGNTMQIQGHTDSTGPDTLNQALSERRANSVKNKLIELGVDPSKLSVVGYGESQPKVDNTTAQNRYTNRRAEAHNIN
ncbi:OmpA family protein [Campylobacter sp. 9BO]|uniref:OmpA family protein n=1 Tax=Campylobacter sp. 9BO TaxID=3424759 RepID=UPI003D337912